MQENVLFTCNFQVYNVQYQRIQIFTMTLGVGTEHYGEVQVFTLGSIRESSIFIK